MNPQNVSTRITSERLHEIACNLHGVSPGGGEGWKQDFIVVVLLMGMFETNLDQIRSKWLTLNVPVPYFVQRPTFDVYKII